MTEENELGRLRWQCRRGIKEVEVVLVPFFDQFYHSIDQREQALFQRLLECHDVEMFEWFTHRAQPEDPELREFVAKVLTLLDDAARA